MPSYAVQYVDRRAVTRREVIDAIDVAMVREIIRGRQGSLIGEISEVGMHRYKPAKLRVKPKLLLVSLESLSLLLANGVTIDKAMRATVGRLNPGPLRFLFSSLTREVENGSQLAKAMEAFPRIFPEAVFGLIKAYESSGSLDRGLEKVAEYFARIEELRGNVARGLMVPIAGICFAFAAVSLILLFTVPKFKDLLLDRIPFKDLPILTQYFFNVSDFYRNYPVVVFGGMIALFFAFRYALRMDGFQKAVTRLALRLPVLGKALLASALARFCTTYVALSQVGFGSIDILEIGARSVGNPVVRDGLERARRAILNSDSIADAFKKQSDVFPPDFVAATSISVDNLPAILGRMGDYYAKEAKNGMAAAIALIEPMMAAFLGLIAMAVGLALFLPIITLIKSAMTR